MSLLIPHAVRIRRFPHPEAAIRAYDVRFYLNNKIVSKLQPDPDIFRTMTVGPRMYTEYKALADMPLLTFFHECGHLQQWAEQGFPQTPNFLLNYIVLKSDEWELEAQSNVYAIWMRKHSTIDVPPNIRPLFKQPTDEDIRKLALAA